LGDTPITRRPSIPPRLADRLGVTPERDVWFREKTLRTGDRVRLVATLEALAVPLPRGYRSGIGTKLVVRHELGPVVLAARDARVDSDSWR